MAHDNDTANAAYRGAIRAVMARGQRPYWITLSKDARGYAVIDKDQDACAVATYATRVEARDDATARNRALVEG